MKLKADNIGYYSLETQPYYNKKHSPVTHNKDTSKGQGVQIGREIQYLAEDFQKFKEDFLALRAAELNKDSPYVQDRDTIDKTKLLDSPHEADWRKVESKSTINPLVKNIKKLNII